MTNQQLIEDNMKLVTFLIKKHYPTLLSDEDIFQCGMLGLCKAANTWDETKSVFSTYASVCILTEIRMELRKRKKHKGVLSLDYEYDDTAEGVIELKDMIVGDEDIDYVDLQSVYERLTPFEKKVFDYKRMGMNGTEIANKVGCNRQNVSRILRGIRKKWKDVIGGN